MIPLTPRFKRGAEQLYFSPDRTPRTVKGELFSQNVPLPPLESWNMPENSSFSPDNSAATYNHQSCYKNQPLPLMVLRPAIKAG
jgi:hypothetical protein